ncbi:Sua5/YciO/YrdC/YwlC family protein [Mycoplasmopsis opalescens]|uniref:Sua5/YciO/YrdC/YwlC family protein n=1 Tax=Mycoplasmopsis opalescens TaxID=114886 RepID=UPI0004A70A3F|nr:Sua5/YciO/YrdC/YwlC family protein [Mycoplasmopsis opalescens]
MDNLFLCSTDTVAGIGGPINNTTLDLIYALKNRPKHKKIIILVGSIEQAKKYFTSYFDEGIIALCNILWPGSFSIIIKDQGFRMPNCVKLCDFLLKNGPMYVTSANISGEPTQDLATAQKDFPTIKHIYDFCDNPSKKASYIYDSNTKSWLR